jgi:hypothetical protein
MLGLCDGGCGCPFPVIGWRFCGEEIGLGSLGF